MIATSSNRVGGARSAAPGHRPVILVEYASRNRRPQFPREANAPSAEDYRTPSTLGYASDSGCRGIGQKHILHAEYLPAAFAKRTQLEGN